jgi:hypothetical protein
MLVKLTTDARMIRAMMEADRKILIYFYEREIFFWTSFTCGQSRAYLTLRMDLQTNTTLLQLNTSLTCSG